MSKIKNNELDQHGTESFEHQQFGAAGIEGVDLFHSFRPLLCSNSPVSRSQNVTTTSFVLKNPEQ